MSQPSLPAWRSLATTSTVTPRRKSLTVPVRPTRSSLGKWRSAPPWSLRPVQIGTSANTLAIQQASEREVLKLDDFEIMMIFWRDSENEYPNRFFANYRYIDIWTSFVRPTCVPLVGHANIKTNSNNILLKRSTICVRSMCMLCGICMRAGKGNDMLA